MNFVAANLRWNLTRAKQRIFCPVKSASLTARFKNTTRVWKHLIDGREARMIRSAILTLSLLATTPASSETVDVKYRGVVDLKPFACTDTPRSSFIQRVCYDTAQSYMLINLRGTYYHYCELPAGVFDAFVTSPSMGQFYNQKIKGSGADGPFDCRTHRAPTY
jgi:hypothetical protein